LPKCRNSADSYRHPIVRPRRNFFYLLRVAASTEATEIFHFAESGRRRRAKYNRWHFGNANVGCKLFLFRNRIEHSQRWPFTTYLPAGKKAHATR